MNNLSQLEKDLRVWVPRQPSAKVKPRIFGGAPDRERYSLPAWSWLAPAAACLFVALAVVNQRDSLPRTGRVQNATMLAASNQSCTVSSSNTFGWTNEAVLTSSMRSPLMSGTNN